MTSRTTARFREAFAGLPTSVFPRVTVALACAKTAYGDVR